MVAPVPPGAPRPNSQQNSGPPNFYPGSQGNSNALADNMQNLSLNRPPPMMPGSGPRPPPPFGQSPQPFPQQSPSYGAPQRGPSPMSRPGPPAGMARPGGPPPVSQPAGFQSNVPLNRPTGPPSRQPSFGSRPSMPGGPVAQPAASSSGFPAFGPSGSVAAGPPPGSRPMAFGSPPPVGSGMSMPPSGMIGGPVSNGHQMVGSGGFPRGTQFPGAAVTTPQAPYVRPPSAPYARTPPQPLGSHSLSGNPPLTPFTAPSMPPPATFPGAPHGRPAVSGLPYGPPSAQVAPPLGFPGQMQPPRYGMGPLPNQSMTNIPTAMGQPGATVPGPSRIDPNQIPRPGSSSSPTVFETRQSNQANPPPPATSDYVVRDTGNCSPRYMRCTINQIPCTVDLLSTSGMQLALMVQPLALSHPSEEPIQVVDFGEGGPVRCSRCKGYINPFMKFIDQGRKFICNFCGYTDETPRDYHCNLGPDGRRRDVDERPELCRGTVEFVATKEYMVRDPMPAVYFFLIDVSMNAIQTGATAAACNAIQQVLSDLPEGPRTFVGIATFDSTIHFYNLKRALQQPLMLIVPDVQDVYTPLETDVVVQLSECRQHLELLLDSIPTMFQESKIPESAFGAAVKAAFLAMKSKGGKLMVFQSILCSVGVGALSSREAEGRANMSAGEKEAHKLLQPADKTLKTMAIEFAEYQVCVDIFITTQAYVDMASISVIPRTTGGQVYCYYPFSALSDPPKLYNDLKWNITRPQGFEAVMRVRCSQGIQVQEYSGNFCKRIPTDIDLPAIDCDKAVMVTLKHELLLPPITTMCTLEKRGDLFLLTLTGDGEHRFHPDTIATILSLLEQAKSQSTRGSILITTANGKFFSNGFDLAWAQTAGSKTGAANRLHQMVESFKPVVAALLDLPMPTIAALNGHAAAAGLILALSHDYVFMRKDRGVLYMSEVDIGLSMPDYFSALVRAKIGTSAARRELLLSGKKIRGEEAVGLGIVDSAAYDSEEGVVVASVRLGEKLAAKKWSGEVYASIRKSLYPELCGILGLETRVFATPKL